MADQPDLDTLYAPPSPMIEKAMLDRIVDYHADYLRIATFFCLATGRSGGLDASPRGGPPGFVHVLDPRTVAFADWPGNNRIESMRNIQADDRVAMLFLFPGLEVFLRINGNASVSTEPALLDRLKEGERLPKAATVVAVNEVLFHCGKAVNRAKLWLPESRIDRTTLPTVGKMLVALADLQDADADAFDAHYDHAVRNELY
ncbi:MSMEG_1061 family FMN-dependent PPOX-type flavoprotein [Sphingomonas colocasiae]|uniref:Pyridoxamine 5'-phosphate oxidase family protein n=1 Tax=Sphingomonas colocasiae TaxID=1848973 RepID=A0ABS7PZG8_9SPHN|nr:MSMEG_1061 family FMN-dependent PPOX-type flavoprotein [Sphingomonas colocasiae]MBY8826339.1 pyridoxamine 5'-phosphate oxidase family protein [Sphingomonas colocasiae]